MHRIYDNRISSVYVYVYVYFKYENAQPLQQHWEKPGKNRSPLYKTL